MKLGSAISLIILLGKTVEAQENLSISPIDTALAQRITISGFCLCQTTLQQLQSVDRDLKKIEVEEMDLPKNCSGQDSRFENGKGYYSKKFPGLIFQKDQGGDYISKIRLTKEFTGTLPDGNFIDVKNLHLKDLFSLYPSLKDKWGSRGCSNYWSFSNDTLFFYVKIDSTRKPQFPIDEAYYHDKPIEAIDVVVSCYSIFQRATNRYKQLFNDPVYFIDSINVTRIELQEYQPTDIASVTVYKNQNAIDLVGPQGKYGAVYIETKKFARSKYWKFLSSYSSEYLKIVPTPESDSAVVYIVNGKVFDTNPESELSSLRPGSLLELKIIDADTLKKKYTILNKDYGILITTKHKNKTDK